MSSQTNAEKTNIEIPVLISPTCLIKRKHYRFVVVESSHFVAGDEVYHCLVYVSYRGDAERLLTAKVALSYHGQEDGYDILYVSGSGAYVRQAIIQALF